MQDNQQTLEDSQSKLRRDILNNSFSDLEEDQEDENLQNLQQTVQIDISEQHVLSSHVIIKQELQESVPINIQPQSIQACVQEMQRNNQETHQLSGIVQVKNQQFDKRFSQELVNRQNDKIGREHIEKMRLIYSRSFLGQQKLNLSQIRKLKSFLYIPKHGEELIRWGNQKFGTKHSVVSALQRLEYMQDSECSELTVKLKQNLKYLLIISLCLLVIKLFV